jgi:hypothetical protein
MANGINRIATIGGDVPSNGAAPDIQAGVPYIVHVTIQGAADLLMHRWNCDAVDAKAGAAKGSKSKKTDNVESYCYRLDDGTLGIPGEYLRMALIGAAKYEQDPRSPRKSAADLFKAEIVMLTHLASLGTKAWDYLDTRRAVVQRSGINRTRPAMKAGWRLSFEIMVQQGSLYIPDERLLHTMNQAGRLIGLGDFRPTFGRFAVVSWEISHA